MTSNNLTFSQQIALVIVKVIGLVFILGLFIYFILDGVFAYNTQPANYNASIDKKPVSISVANYNASIDKEPASISVANNTPIIIEEKSGPYAINSELDRDFVNNFKKSIDCINDVNVPFTNCSNVFMVDAQEYIKKYPEKEPILEEDFRRLHASIFIQLKKRMQGIYIDKVSVVDHLNQEEKRFYLDITYQSLVNPNFKQTDEIMLRGFGDIIKRVQDARPAQKFEVMFGKKDGKYIVKML